MRNAKNGLLAALTLLALSTHAWATEPVATAITVEKMHCMSCAGKMADELYTVAGVAKVSADVKAKRLTVTTKPGAVPSPRALWEAIEKAGYKPTRLEGPGGKFAAKPGA